MWCEDDSGASERLNGCSWWGQHGWQMGQQRGGWKTAGRRSWWQCSSMDRREDHLSSSLRSLFEVWWCSQPLCSTTEKGIKEFFRFGYLWYGAREKELKEIQGLDGFKMGNASQTVSMARFTREGVTVPRKKGWGSQIGSEQGNQFSTSRRQRKVGTFHPTILSCEMLLWGTWRLVARLPFLKMSWGSTIVSGVSPLSFPEFQISSPF